MTDDAEGKTPTKVPARGPGLVLFLATGLGFGYSPAAPGTVGALWGIPLAWAIAQLPGIAGQHVVWTQVAAILLLVAVGIPLCTAAAVELGGVKDPKQVVWDEIATMPIVFLGMPPGELTFAWPWVLVLGFILHRIFDISKPPPCRQLEHLPRGLGIMADDVASSIYACFSLHAALWLLDRAAPPLSRWLTTGG